MTGPVLQAVVFDAPLVNGAPQGLYGVTTWTDETGPPRWLASGVQIRPHNYGGYSSFGIWDQPWCSDPGSAEDVKFGVRPDIPDAFEPLTIWAYDSCDLTAPSRDEVRVRAAQVLRLEEQVAVERSFATRLLTDAGAATPVSDLLAAVGVLEGALAVTNTVGMIHAGAQWVAEAARYNPLTASGGTMRTPLGHLWAFGGGYVDGLANALVATSSVFGWRNAAAVREVVDHQRNQFIVIAERSVVVGYEQCVGAAEVTV